ncbi:MAG TPA: SDR family oxidoreductase [Solirubrobacteraceae bacterium]|nr:SDR family oxidoreductase [Solirubrobacteraceae bacterium]
MSSVRPVDNGAATRPAPALLSRFDLTGRVAIVTGGHGVLAEAIAGALAELGCSVTLAARHLDQCEDLAHRLETAYGVRTMALPVDVSDEGDVERLVSTVNDELGGVDVVVNSAATFWAAAPEDVPTARGWRRVLDVNLTGSFLVCRAAGRLMLAQGRGSIINVSSVGGLMSYLPEVGSTLSYTTTKGALINLTRDLASQWADRGVRVNAIAPGSIDGGMTHTIPDDRQERLLALIPMRRFGRPDELQGAVAYLASDASSYVTGTVMVIDGGQTIV